MNKALLIGALVTIISINHLSFAKDVIVFPAKGQSNEKMDKDKYSCYGWAKGETGFDPMVTAKTSAPPPSQQKSSGGILRGGVGGAVVGGILGGSRGAGRGAAAGGIIGGVRQNSRNNTVDQNTQQWRQQEASKYANDRSKYNRAYSACLEGKGYTVK